MNKDFYNDLPGMICVQLEHLIEKYGHESWFNEAWEKYREHIKESDMDTMRMPSFIFKDYIIKKDPNVYLTDKLNQ